MSVVESLFHCVPTYMEFLLCLMYGGGAHHMTILLKMAVIQGLHFSPVFIHTCNDNNQMTWQSIKFHIHIATFINK